MQGEQLLAEGQILEDEILAGAEAVNQAAKQMPKPHNHGRNLIEAPSVEPVPKSLYLRAHEVLRTHKGNLAVHFSAHSEFSVEYFLGGGQ